MISEIQGQKGCLSSVGDMFRSVKNEVKCRVRDTAQVAFSCMEYAAGTLFDWGVGVDYSCQWIGDYSSCSSRVKETAGKVKGAADRFNLFAAFSNVITSGKNLITKPIESVEGAAEAVVGYAAASVDFTGRLAGLKLISLGSAAPYVGGIDAIATSAFGVKGVRDVLRNSEENRSAISSMIKLSKNVTLAVLGVLCGISACFVSIAAGIPQLPLYILIAATTYLGLKVVDCFYDKLALPSPLDATAFSVAEDETISV